MTFETCVAFELEPTHGTNDLQMNHISRRQRMARYMMLTVLATLNHVDQEIRVILAINVTFVAVFVIWIFLLVRLHIFLSGKVAEAVFVGTSKPLRAMS
jgi:hypothetical protein